MTLDTYSDLFPDDLDAVAARLDEARAQRVGVVWVREVQSRRGDCEIGHDLRKRGGAEGNRTPDLFDANEARYQLRYSPMGRLPGPCDKFSSRPDPARRVRWHPGPAHRARRTRRSGRREQLAGEHRHSVGQSHLGRHRHLVAPAVGGQLPARTAGRQRHPHCVATATQEASAATDSGDSEPVRPAITAPAPRDPRPRPQQVAGPAFAGRHHPDHLETLLTDPRRHRRGVAQAAPTTVVPVSASWRQIADPLGEGNTKRGFASSTPPGSPATRTERGDRLTSPAVRSLRPTASTADLVAAKAAAEASRKR